MIPENFPLAENIGPGHVPRHGSVTGTATERQQPLPCRLQAPAGNAAVFPGQAPRFGEPFFLVTLPDLSEASGECFPMCQKKCRLLGKERLFAFRACHLRAFGLWKLVHRSTLRQRPGVPGNALRRIFRCLPVMGPGAAAGRVAGSGPVWKITTLLED